MVDESVSFSPIVDNLFRTLAPFGLRFEGRPPSRPASLQLWIEAISSPALLRAIWRSLRRFTVLDPQCRGGARLVLAGRTLEPVFLAVLERMRAFVDDAASSRYRRRPEHLRDMRSLVDLAEDAGWGHDRETFVRRTIVRQSLFGIATSKSGIRRTVRDLLSYAGLDRSGLAIIDCNVRPFGDSIAAISSAGDQQLKVAPSPEGDRLREEIDLFRTAWDAVRKSRAFLVSDQEEFATAAAQLERRRQYLRRQLLVIAAKDALAEESRMAPLPELGFSDARALTQFSTVLA